MKTSCSWKSSLGVLQLRSCLQRTFALTYWRFCSCWGAVSLEQSPHYVPMGRVRVGCCNGIFVLMNEGLPNFNFDVGHCQTSWHWRWLQSNQQCRSLVRCGFTFEKWKRENLPRWSGKNENTNWVAREEENNKFSATQTKDVTEWNLRKSYLKSQFFTSMLLLRTTVDARWFSSSPVASLERRKTGAGDRGFVSIITPVYVLNVHLCKVCQTTCQTLYLWDLHL